MDPDCRTTAQETQRFETRPAGIGVKLGLLTALFACAGCSAAFGSETPSANRLPSDGNSAGPAAATVSVQGITRASDGSPVAGVAVCLRPYPTSPDHTSCTTSDGSGAWTLASVPSSALVAITFVKSGFFPTLRAIATTTSDLTIPPGDGVLIGSRDPAGRIMSGLEFPATADGRLGQAINPGVGYVAFSTATPGTQPTAAATVTLDFLDMSGIPTAAPTYYDASGNAALSATSGTSGIFVGLTPGFYAMTFSGDAAVACDSAGPLYGAPVTAFTPAGQARIILPVAEGFLTTPIAASCR
jgi:hypothetical protein